MFTGVSRGVVTVSHRGGYSHAEAQRNFEHAERKVSRRGTEGTEGAAPGRIEGNGGNGERPTVADSPNSEILIDSEKLIDSENILLNLQMPPRLCVK